MQPSASGTRYTGAEEDKKEEEEEEEDLLLLSFLEKSSVIASFNAA
jgi:hypothetical protein